MRRSMTDIVAAAMAVGLILAGLTLSPQEPLIVVGALLAIVAVAYLLASRLLSQRDQEMNREQTRNQITSLMHHLQDSESALSDLQRRFSEQLTLTATAEESVRELKKTFRELETHVDSLSASAAQSASAILQLTTNNEEVAVNMTAMGISVRDTVNSIGQMARSVKEVAANVDELSTTAEETSSAMNQMDVSINQVQTHANDTAIISEGVASDAERSAAAVAKTIDVIKEAKKSSQEAMEVIRNLGKKIEAIGQILSVIDDVAEQTNLLALNAAIIAAQAGEHGKGFAVVADEIKDLAERSGVSTKEIAGLIRAIQSETRNAISAVETGNANVDKGVQVSDDAERALRQILESSQKATNMMRSIARATVEQSKGSKQVTDAIGRIAESVQQIAKATSEQARDSSVIISGAEKMRSITQHVERSTAEQSKGGREISNAIETISTMVSQLGISQKQHFVGSEELLGLTGRIREQASENQSVLTRIRELQQRMKQMFQNRMFSGD
jgi:methyl-accepting chemotaxis protein